MFDCPLPVVEFTPAVALMSSVDELLPCSDPEKSVKSVFFGLLMNISDFVTVLSGHQDPRNGCGVDGRRERAQRRSHEIFFQC